MNGDKILVNSKDFFWKKHNDFLSTIISSYPVEDETIHLFEDNLAVLSLIQSLKANKLLLMNNTSLDVMLELADKWCVEQWLIDLIKDEIIQTQKKSDINSVINSFTFKCAVCYSGYDIYHNKPGNCKSHRLPFNIAVGKYPCCGATREQDFCIKGTHTPMCSSMDTFINLYKLKLNTN